MLLFLQSFHGAAAAGCRLSVPEQDCGGESPTGAPQESVRGKQQGARALAPNIGHINARTGLSSSSKQPKVRQQAADTPSKEVRAKSRRRLKPLGACTRGFFFQEAPPAPATRRSMLALEHGESASPECVIEDPGGDHVDQWVGRNIPGCMQQSRHSIRSEKTPLVIKTKRPMV